MICYFYKVLFSQVLVSLFLLLSAIYIYTLFALPNSVSTLTQTRSSDTFFLTPFVCLFPPSFISFSTALETRLKGSFSHRMSSSWHWNNMAHKKAEDDDWNLCESYRICELKLHGEKRVWEYVFDKDGVKWNIHVSRIESSAGGGGWEAQRESGLLLLVCWWYERYECSHSLFLHDTYTTLPEHEAQNWVIIFIFISLLSVICSFILYVTLALTCAIVFIASTRIFGLRVCMNVKLNLRLINMQFMLVFIGRFVRYPSRRLCISIVSQSQSSRCYGCWLSEVTRHLSEETKQCEKMTAVKDIRGQKENLHNSPGTAHLMLTLYEIRLRFSSDYGRMMNLILNFNANCPLSRGKS